MRPLKMAALLAMVSLALAQTNANPPTSEKVREARKLLAQGSRDLAGRTLVEAVRADPDDGPAQLLLGEMLEEDGRVPEAMGALTTAVRLLPNSAEAHNALGETFADLNSMDPARAEFEKALQLNSSLPLAHLNLGMVEAQTEELTSAAKHLDFAIAKLTRAEDLARAHYLRAKVYTDLSQAAHARSELDLAVKLAPGFAEAWSDLGRTRKTLLDDAGAVAAFERAVELSPSDAVALTRLGGELYEQGKVEEAIMQLEKADRINPRDQTILNTLQAALRTAGQTTKADEVKEHLVEVLRERDRNTQNQLNAARLNIEGAKLAENNDFNGAIEKFRRGVELDSENVGVRANLAVALLRKGEWREGLFQLSEALRRQPGNAKLKAAWDDALHKAPPGSWTDPGGSNH